MSRPIFLRALVIFLLATLLRPALPSHAQTDSATMATVYLARGATPAAAKLHFLDSLTGLTTVVDAPGVRHTRLGDAVIYEEAETGAIKIAFPNGQTGFFALMPNHNSQSRVFWAVAADKQSVVWSVTIQGASGLSSDLFVADALGGNKRLVLHTSSTSGIGLYPLLISGQGDGQAIFYSRRDDLFAANFTDSFLQTGDVYRLQLSSGDTATLPSAEGCPCPVGLSASGQDFVRAIATGRGGYDLYLWRLEAGAASAPTRIPANQQGQSGAGGFFFNPAGDALFFTTIRAPAGVRAEYSLMWAVASSGQQKLLVGQLRSEVRVVASFNALLATSAARDGTYKIIGSAGLFVTVSALTLLP
jgi:hypothetical protein